MEETLIAAGAAAATHFFVRKRWVTALVAVVAWKFHFWAVISMSCVLTVFVGVELIRRLRRQPEFKIPDVPDARELDVIDVEFTVTEV